MQHQQLINVFHQEAKIRISNIRDHVSYILISTEPARKINQNPIAITPQYLEYEFEQSEAINHKLQGFCCVVVHEENKQIQCSIEELPTESRKTRQLFLSKFKIKNYLLKQRVQSWKSISNRQTDSDFKATKSQYYEVISPSQLDAHEIQQMIEYSHKQHGETLKLDLKRNCLILQFEQNINIKQIFKIKQTEDELQYWTIMNHRPFYTIQPLRLMELPIQTFIGNMLIQGQWLIFSTNANVLFLHLYSPLKNFLTVQLQSQYMCGYQKDKIIICQYKYIYVYQLKSGLNPQLIAKMKIKKVQPYSIVFKGESAIISGINYSDFLNQPQQQKEIVLISHFSVKDNRHFLADDFIELCERQKSIPVLNLTYIKNLDLFICSCENFVYVFHLETKSVLSVIELSNFIKKLYRIKSTYQFSVIAKIQSSKKLVQVGFEVLGINLGTQVNSLDEFGDVKDMYVVEDLFTTDGKVIMNQSKHQIITSVACLKDEGCQIRKLCNNGNFLCFLAKNNYEQNIYFIQL